MSHTSASQSEPKVIKLAYRVVARRCAGLAVAAMLVAMLTGCVSSTEASERVNAVTIVPTSVELAPGGSQQFAISTDPSDANKGSLVFSATGGQVDPAGLYTAFGVAGDFQVIVRDEQSDVADTADITIVEPPVEDPPVADGCGGEDSGGWLWCDDFESDRIGEYYEYNDADGSFMRVAGIGRNGSFGMRTQFSAGQVEAGALRLAIGRTPQAYMRSVAATAETLRDVYWRFYVRRQAAWQGGGGDKLTRATVFASSTSFAQAMIAHGWSGASNGPDRDYLVLDPVRGTDETGTLLTTAYNDFANFTWLGAARSERPVFGSATSGAWTCMEFRVRLNDPGTANGRFEAWVNGILEASITNLNWLGSLDEYGINAIFLENYWNAGSPVAQERYFDEFVVSRSPVGC